MVLGLRNRKSEALLQVDYLVCLQGITPWPPSTSLQHIGSLAIHWESGDRNSGFCSCNVGDGVCESNEYFRIQVTLKKESSKKGLTSDSFAKSMLEFTIYEDRKGKSTKGQLIGSAAINLGEYGVIKSDKIISCPLTLKKSFKNTVQSVIYVAIKPYEGSPYPDGTESISEMANDGIDDGSEFASFTDDDVDDAESSSLSSHKAEIFTEQREKARVFDSQRDAKSNNEFSTEEKSPDFVTYKAAIANEFQHEGENSTKESTSSRLADVTVFNAEDGSRPVNHHSVHENITEVVMLDESTQTGNTLVHVSDPMLVQDPEEETENINKRRNDGDSSSMHRKTILLEEKTSFNVPLDDSDDIATSRSKGHSLNAASLGSTVQTRRDKLKHLKSVQNHYSSAETNRAISSTDFMDKARKSEAAHNSIRDDSIITGGRKVESLSLNDLGSHSVIAEVTSIPGGSKNVAHPKDESKNLDDDHCSENDGRNKACETELKKKIAMLEEELIETAAVEFGLYSVIPEHESSSNKVHAAAIRLSRFYVDACKSKNLSNKANASRAIISGLVLVSKACANDVPRLTFWFSNAIALRALINQCCKDERSKHKTFMAAIENIEGWIFSRIIESIWWQTLTPQMQCSAVKGLSTKKSNRRQKLGIQDGENFAIDLWKGAFKDACERLCPVRAAGHECGCLPFLPKLVMEQLLIRLDVAMLNAILRESDEEMPTDPISDPISDLRVLPIPAGRFCFGAGARLKNAVGSWSRWLTDLFGIDDSDLEDKKDKLPSDKRRSEIPFKAFFLLNALSDLMMLPFELLTDKATRKEVCSTFGSSIIKRVLSNFISDEFNPNPMPDIVVNALDSDEHEEEAATTTYPCSASPIVYSPPSAISVFRFLPCAGNQALHSGFASDDELEELDSPMNSVFDSQMASKWMQLGKLCRRNSRFQLLREAWKDDCEFL